MVNRIIITADGSKSIYNAALDETYHSVHGAIQEAKHVFIKHGLNFFSNVDMVQVLEVGFGTGLNAYLTLLEATERMLQIHYTGIEAFPLGMEIVKELNYTSELAIQENKEFFMEMHQVEWNIPKEIGNFFRIEKIEAKVEEVTLQNEQFNLIYFDAFGPRAQSEMWRIEILEKMFRLLKNGGFLVTYCAKGQVKRDLRSAGFTIETLPGPPGKREMTRAWKK